MANYRRKHPKTRTRSGYSNRHWKNKPNYWYWMKSWPAWWDIIIFHRRPPRRITKQLEIAILKGRDPDNIAWPLNKNKHNYYW